MTDQDTIIQDIGNLLLYCEEIFTWQQGSNKHKPSRLMKCESTASYELARPDLPILHIPYVGRDNRRFGLFIFNLFSVFNLMTSPSDSSIYNALQVFDMPRGNHVFISKRGDRLHILLSCSAIDHTSTYLSSSHKLALHSRACENP